MRVFAATPPLEALRFLISEAATTAKEDDINRVMMVRVHVELPEEGYTPEEGQKGLVFGGSCR